MDCLPFLENLLVMDITQAYPSPKLGPGDDMSRYLQENSAPDTPIEA
jgi:hypothetical protein